MAKKKKRKRSPLIPRYAVLPLIFCLLTQLLTYYLPRILGVYFSYNFAVEFDLSIPLIPAFSYVYIGAFLFWTVNYIYICRQSRTICLRLVIADTVTKAICLYAFLKVPTSYEAPAALLADPAAQIFPDAASIEGAGAWLLKLIYSMDEPNNLLPSLHCCVSWLCLRPLLTQETWAIPKGYKVFSFICVILIFLSTLFTRQHVVLDVAAGVFAAEAGWQLSRFVPVRDF